MLMTSSCHPQGHSDLRMLVADSTPIDRLPDGILYEIFLAILYPSPYHVYKRNVLKISYVCHRWRVVTLRSPKLWTIIHWHDVHPEFLIELVKRSKHAPLTIHWATNKQDVEPAVKTLLMEFPRVQDLSLSVCREIHNEITIGAPQSAPNLMSVKFTDMFEVYQRGGHPLPTFLDHCDMPSLREVELSGYQITGWSKTLFPSSLTRLEVQAPYSNPAMVSFTETLEAIARIPGLVDLDLEDCIGDPLIHSSSLVVNPENRITLAHLDSLYLSSRAIACAHFLDHLTVPASARIVLTYQKDDSLPVETAASAIFQSVQSKISGSSLIGHRETIRSATICDQGYYNIELCLWSRVHAARHRSGSIIGDNVPLPSFQLTIHESLGGSSNDFLDFFATLPLCDVEAISIEDCIADHRSRRAYVKLFRQMPNISTLYVSASGRVNWLRRILLSHMGDPEDDGYHSTPYLLSSLRTFILARSHSNSSTRKRRDDLLTLMLAIKEREGHGIILDEANVKHPKDLFDNRRRTKCLANHVSWEGYSNDFLDFTTDTERYYDSDHIEVSSDEEEEEDNGSEA